MKLPLIIFIYLYNNINLNILDVEVACYAYEGVDAVKTALRAGLNQSTEEMPIKVCVQIFCYFYLWSMDNNSGLSYRSTW